MIEVSIDKNEKKPTEKNRIRKQRRDFKLSQREFSRATGIPLGTVRNWEQEKCNPPEYLYGMLYELLRRNSMLNVKTLKVISLLNELAKKEKNGIREFKNANEGNRETFVFYDATSCTRREDGALLYKVPYDMCIIDDETNKHHDIISYYGDDDYSVMVVDDRDGELFLEVHFPAEEEFIEFSNGEWYFA